MREDEAISIEELDEILSTYGEPVSFCGDGVGVTLPALQKTEALPVPDRLVHQSAYSTAQVALRAYRAGCSTNDAEFTVTYLRPSQAERNYLEKQSAAKN